LEELINLINTNNLKLRIMEEYEKTNRVMEFGIQFKTRQDLQSHKSRRKI